MNDRRNTTHKGRVICISGASNRCMVWIDDKPVLGMFRFKTLLRARRAAVDYVERHSKVAQ